MALIPCPGCGRIISDAAASCVQCGRPIGIRSAADPGAAPESFAQPGGVTAPPVPPARAARPPFARRAPVAEPVDLHTFFPVTMFKFVVMSIVTFNIYGAWWAYRNWQRINTRATTNDSVSPFWRAVFAPIWGFSLFTRVRDTAERRLNIWWSPEVLGGLYLVLSLSRRLPEPWSVLGMLAFVALLPVVHTIQQLHATEPAAEGQNGGFSSVNIVGIIFGGILVALALVGTFLVAPDVE